MKKIKEFSEKENAVLLLTGLEEKTTSTGKSYLVLSLCDGSDTIQAKMWDSSKGSVQVDVGNLVKVVIKTGSYQGKKDFVVYSCELQSENAEYHIADFIKSAPVNASAMYEYLLKVADNMDNKEIGKTTRYILEKNKDKLLTWAAAVGVHHNYNAGLLYHMYRMTQAALLMSKVYTNLNKPVLVAGAMLHDIGKLTEMETDLLGNATFTVNGNLFGHLFLGAEAFRKAADETGLNANDNLQISHIIASHHGKGEWGAITVPSTMEAIVVNHLDMIDSRVEQVENIVEDMDAQTFTQEKFYTLDGAHIYKG